MVKITGTLIWYYYICKRQVWLMSRELNPYEQDDFLVLGRFLSEETYGREKKEIRVDNISIDLIKKDQNSLLVGEVKKSSRYLKPATMQLAYYLKVLSKKGIKAKGVLLIPRERKRIKVSLTRKVLEELDGAQEEMLLIMDKSFPPPPKKISWCKNCAYKEFCFS